MELLRVAVREHAAPCHSTKARPCVFRDPSPRARAPQRAAHRKTREACGGGWPQRASAAAAAAAGGGGGGVVCVESGSCRLWWWVPPLLLQVLPVVLDRRAACHVTDMTAVVETIVSATSIVASGAVFADVDQDPKQRSSGSLKLAPLSDDYEVPEVEPDTAVRVVSDVLKSLCMRNDVDVVVPDPEVDLSCFYSVQKQDFDLEFYVRRVFKYVDTTPNAFVNALVYLNRLEYASDLLKVNSFNVHRVFLTAVVVATKFLDDQVYSNRHYATVGGVSSTHEMNQLELTMLKKLKFKVHVDLETHKKYQRLFFG